MDGATLADWDDWGDDPDPDDPRWYLSTDDDGQEALTPAERNPSLLLR